MNLRDSWFGSLNVGSPRRKAATYTGEQTQKRRQIYIHVSGGIRTHDPSI
jgi:hypothetical protein